MPNGLHPAKPLKPRDVITIAPLATCDAELDRTQWELVPGDVVKLDWSDHQMNVRYLS